MRLALLKNIAALLIPGICIALCRCTSLSTDDPLAGGSGAGNPGGTVELSMVAIADQGINKTSVVGTRNFKLLDSSRSITVTDKGGLQFILTDITLSDIDVRFMLDTAEKPEQLLSSMLEEPAELSSDTHSIVLDGSHAFDALGEMIDSSVASLLLPVARYTGVALGFSESFDPDKFAQQRTPLTRIAMNGTFCYSGVKHQIAIISDCSLWPCLRVYRFGGGIFTLSPADTTHLELQFNSRQWFSSVDIAASLNNGALTFDANGALNIVSLAGCRLYREIVFAITQGFLSSGKLTVY